MSAAMYGGGGRCLIVGNINSRREENKNVHLIIKEDVSYTIRGWY